MLRALLGTALVLRLLVDMATPLMPGAFRFNPAESIEAHRSQPVRGAEQAVVRPTGLPPTGVAEVVRRRPDLPARPARDHPSPAARPFLARHLAGAASGIPRDVAEDH